MFSNSFFGFVTVHFPYDLFTLEQLENIKPDDWIDDVLVSPLVYRESEELKSNSIDDVKDTALKMCHLVLFWLKENYKKDAVLVWKMAIHRYSIKVSCAAYSKDENEQT